MHCFFIMFIIYILILIAIKILITGWVRNVHFEFFLNADTASSIALEMVETLDLMKVDVDLVAELINILIVQLVPCWGSSFKSLTRQRSLDGVTSVHYEAKERGIYSEVTGITNNGALIASSQHVNPSTSNVIRLSPIILSYRPIMQLKNIGEALSNP